MDNIDFIKILHEKINRDKQNALMYVSDGIVKESFCYTVGLTKFTNLPELLVFGLDQNTCLNVMNKVIDLLLNEQVITGIPIIKMFEEFDITLQKIDNDTIEKYLLSAVMFNKNENIELKVLQIVIERT